jgi:hypothetical protein
VVGSRRQILDSLLDETEFAAGGNGLQ